MRTLTIVLQANQVVPLEVAGLYFEILSCSYDLARIDWIDRDGQTVDPWLNVKEGLYGAFEYRAIVITNGPTAQTIKVLVGRGTGGNRAVPVGGTVAISGGVKTPIQQAARLGFTYADNRDVGNGGVNSSAYMLWNPTAGSKRIVMGRAVLAGQLSLVTCYFIKASFTAAPAGSSVLPIGDGSTASTARYLRVQNQAVAGPVALMTAAGFTAPATRGLGQIQALPNGSYESPVVADGGVVLAPGEAFVMYLETSAAAALLNTVSWLEE